MKTMTRVWWGVGVVAFVLADAALWWESSAAEVVVRPALVGAASAFGAAGIGVVSALAASSRAHVYTRRAAMTAERQLAYAQLLAFASEYAQASKTLAKRQETLVQRQKAFVQCQEDVRKAKADQKELATATYALKDAESQVRAEMDRLNAQLDQYTTARARITLLAPAPVRHALEQLANSLLLEQGYEHQQEAFVEEARKDLGLPRSE